MNLLLSLSAEQDLLAGHDFYEKQATGVCTYFLDSLFADIDSLVLYAGIHPKPDGRFYRTLAKRFPYAIYYQLADTTVTIVAVLDCRRQPGRNRRTLQGRQ